jgi:hypothetical protein
MASITANIKPLRLFLFLTVCALMMAAGNSLFAGRRYDAGTPAVDPAVRPILLVDPTTRMMYLRVAGTDIWEMPFEIQSGTALDVDRFFSSLAATIDGGPIIIEGRHLYRGRGEFAPGELQAVAEELKIEPDVLQRTYPGEMALVFPGGHILEVSTNIDAPPLDAWHNFGFDAQRFIAAPFTERCARITMKPADALTLYHAAATGLPVAIHF